MLFLRDADPRRWCRGFVSIGRTRVLSSGGPGFIGFRVDGGRGTGFVEVVVDVDEGFALRQLPVALAVSGVHETGKQERTLGLVGIGSILSG